MTPALRWAAMKAILMFHSLWGTKSKQCPQTTTFEEKGELKQYWTEVLPLISLTAKPNRLTYGGGGRRRLYTYRYTDTTRMISALRWALMRAILMFCNCEGQVKSQDSIRRPQLLKRKESWSSIKPRSFRLPAYRLTTRPNRLSWSCIIWTQLYL